MDKETIVNIGRFVGRDKVLHFIAGLALCFVVGAFASPTWGMAAVIVAMAGKEAYDFLYYGRPDIFDFIAGIAGGGLGLVLLNAVG